jgi:cobalt/nickel transport system permease protein
MRMRSVTRKASGGRKLSARLRSRCVTILVITAVLLLAWPQKAHAMHLSEGILPAPWAAGWYLVAAPFVLWGLREICRRRAVDPRSTTLLALVGSAVFVISCMPVPIPGVGSCSHPCGTGLAAVLVGAGPTIVVAAIALVFQALFLAHGGITTLGANIVSMGVVGAISAVLAFRLLVKLRMPPLWAAFAAGLLSDWATYATTSLELASALHGDGSFWTMFFMVVAAFVPTQSVLGIAEGFMTAVAYQFILAHRPELLVPGRILRPAGEEA